LLIPLIPGVLGQTYPVSRDDPAISAAVGYMASHQIADGGFGQLGESDLSTTSRVIEALVAAGLDPQSYRPEGKSPLDFILSVADSVYEGTMSDNSLGDRINLVLAATALGMDVRDLGPQGRDFVDLLLTHQNGSTGCFGMGSSDTAYSVLALLSAGAPTDHPSLQKALNYLETSQLEDGTFEYSPGWGGDSNTHFVVVIALKKMGETGAFVEKAVAAITGYQNATNRGFYYQGMWTTDPDVSSTALGIAAIVAAGDNPVEAPYAQGGENPVKHLLSVQGESTGEFVDPYGSLRPTALAIPALLGYSIPSVNVPEAGSVCFSLMVLGALKKRCDI
jgi:hypothetical protein